MKNLFFIMMAILLINTSYAVEMGENEASDCGNQVQASRFSGAQQVETSTETPAVRTDVQDTTVQ